MALPKPLSAVEGQLDTPRGTTTPLPTLGTPYTCPSAGLAGRVESRADNSDTVTDPAGRMQGPHTMDLDVLFVLFGAMVGGWGLLEGRCPAYFAPETPTASCPCTPPPPALRLTLRTLPQVVFKMQVGFTMYEVGSVRVKVSASVKMKTRAPPPR